MIKEFCDNCGTETSGKDRKHSYSDTIFLDAVSVGIQITIQPKHSKHASICQDCADKAVRVYRNEETKAS